MNETKTSQEMGKAVRRDCYPGHISKEELEKEHQGEGISQEEGGMKDEDWDELEYEIGMAIDELIERDSEKWTEKKIARYLREKARYLDPPKPRRRTIDPLECSDEDFARLRKEDQNKFKPLRDAFRNPTPENKKRFLKILKKHEGVSAKRRVEG